MSSSRNFKGQPYIGFTLVFKLNVPQFNKSTTFNINPYISHSVCPLIFNLNLEYPIQLLLNKTYFCCFFWLLFLTDHQIQFCFPFVLLEIGETASKNTKGLKLRKPFKMCPWVIKRPPEVCSTLNIASM